LTTKPDDARARAEANFKKEERAREGAQAMQEYQTEGRMVREKTERLKALRLAKEAAEQLQLVKEAAEQKSAKKKSAR
jgi:hypothetical protein